MRLLLLLGTLLILTGCAKKGDQENMSSMSASDMKSMNMMSGDMMKNMAVMNDSMVTHLGEGDSLYDERFIDMMIPHHEGAIQMAQDALRKSQHPEIQHMAAAVIASQQREIDAMKRWRHEWYGR